MIVPFAAGGPTDVIARLVAERLSEVLGQQVYVENLPGAGGNLGVETAEARRAGRLHHPGRGLDGFIVNPSMYTKIAYDPIKDFAPISLVAASPNVVDGSPVGAGENPQGADRRSSRPIPANTATPSRRPARRRISPPSCSSRLSTSIW